MTGPPTGRMADRGPVLDGEAAVDDGGGLVGWGLHEVSVWYGKRLALDRVSLLAAAGQVTAVVGGDGAGKTTLLRCLAGALAPGGGRVSKPDTRRIGYLPASSGIYPDLTVAENLAFRAAAYGFPARQAREQAEVYLERAGLAAARDRLAGHLSGGMRQRLGVIAAMVHRPQLLVLDEPTTGVDPVSRSDLWWLIASAAAAGAAVVLSTTYLDEAERAAVVLALDAGRLLATGTPEQIVAAIPGTLRAAAARPADDDRQRAWRRGGRWRIWDPPSPEHQPVTAGTAAGAGGGASGASGASGAIQPDLQDAVTIAALARELRSAGEFQPAGDAPVSAGNGAGHGAGHGAGNGGGAGPLAQCTGVTRRFNQFTAVDGVDLRVEAGEIVGLLGANGAGKTTLIRLLLGLLPASAGEVALFGGQPSRDSRRRIGYLPQGLGLYDDLTAAENLEFSAAVFGTGRRGLPDPRELPGPLRSYAATLVGSLPLGTQRRVAFAQALAHRPDLLILDEPTSGVDPLGRTRLWDTITEAAAGGTGVLVSTHHLDEAGECSRLVIMADGAVVAEGTAAEIIGAARVTVVTADSWAAAFAVLEEAGLPVALAGRALRVPGAGPDEVRRALGGMAAVVTEAPATLEERFFQLILPASITGAAR